MFTIYNSKQLVREELKRLRLHIDKSRVFRPPDVSKFVFLCGAKKNDNEVSERRNALIKFAKTSLPHTQFFLAETMLETLKKEGHKTNILDAENEISQFADYIIIVLESPSSFAELGAFSHRELRNKIIVINDVEFLKSKSFINLGPLKAISDSVGKQNIIHYKMSDDGIHVIDAIGDVYKPLADLLEPPIKGKATPLNLDICAPLKYDNKVSVMFVHDLIYFTGPIMHKELVVILTLLFGNHDFKLMNHVAMLTAFEAITRNKKGLYKSKFGKLYFSYRFDIFPLISMFRNYMLKYERDRIYGY